MPRVAAPRVSASDYESGDAAHAVCLVWTAARFFAGIGACDRSDDGAKELLCGRIAGCGNWDSQQQSRILAGLRRLLMIAPCSKIILNVRLDVQAQAASQLRVHWIKPQERAQKERLLNQLNHDILEAHAQLGLVHLDEH